jgi:hypothetical protein
MIVVSLRTLQFLGILLGGLVISTMSSTNSIVRIILRPNRTLNQIIIVVNWSDMI